jgi:cyanate permease
VYLIRDQFAQTPAPQSFGLFTAAVILATAMTLLFELSQVPRSTWRNAVGVWMTLASHTARTASVARRTAEPPYTRRYEQRYDERTDLP